MKRWIFLMPCLLLLAGCGARVAAEPEAVPTTLAVPAPTQPPQTQPPETETPEPEDDAFVRVLNHLPNARQELFYATEENFTGRPIYDFFDVYLRYGTVKKLQVVAKILEEQGLYFKFWDGFRPVSAQFRLWEVCPDSNFVANPNVGFSSHSRGNTVDVTLVDGEGRELDMPTGFDDFSARADRDYSDCTDAQAANARLLERVMEENGFKGYYGEWWHFADTDVYPVETEYEPPMG